MVLPLLLTCLVLFWTITPFEITAHDSNIWKVPWKEEVQTHCYILVHDWGTHGVSIPILRDQPLGGRGFQSDEQSSVAAIVFLCLASISPLGKTFWFSFQEQFPEIYFGFSSVQFSRSVMSDSLRPHESQHARPPCPSPTPRVHSDSHPSSQWCHPAISSSVVPFSSCPNPSQHQSLFQWVNSSHEVAKVLEFQL